MLAVQSETKEFAARRKIKSLGKTTVALLNPKEAFGIDHFPSFDQLHNTELRTGSAAEDLPEEVMETIGKQLDPIHQMCVRTGFQPLLSEFALITDTSLVGPRGNKPFFTSYLGSFLDPARDVLAAYEEALRHMGAGAPQTEETQIVPHPHLYRYDTALIKHRDCTSLWETLEDGCFDPAAGEPNPERGQVRESARVAAVRQPFSLIREPRPDGELERQVDGFLKMLGGCLCRKLGSVSAIHRLMQAQFLLLPFARPGYESAATPQRNTTIKTLRGDPGGALFLFVEPMSADSQMDDLVFALSWLLAESSLR